MIARHKIDGYFNFEKEVKRKLNHITLNLEQLSIGEKINLSSLSTSCLECFYLYLYDQEKGGKYQKQFKWTPRQYLQLALESDILYIKLAMNPGSEGQITIDGITYEFIGEETTLNIGAWNDIFYLALLLRDENAMKFILSIPEEFIQKDALVSDPYYYYYIDFLKSLYLDTNSAPDKFTKAYKATDPKLLKHVDPMHVLNMVVPEMDLYKEILLKNQDGFNEALEEKLNYFQYDITENEIAGSPNFFYDIYALGVCAFAYDRGFKINVESPYIPKKIYEGNF